MAGVFDKLKKWIDGEDELDEQADAQTQQQRSRWNDFLVAIAREIEATMQREMFTPPGSPTYIPREYIVFLNPEDDAEWQGEKRDGLQRGLHYVLSERAKVLAGDNEFQTSSFAVDLRVDPSLERSRFSVKPVWDPETEKTRVTPRKQQPAEDDEKTEVRPRKLQATDDEEKTQVKPRKPATPLYSLAVRSLTEPNATVNGIDIYKEEITIGRGAKAQSVDVLLEGDMEISRIHARLKKVADGRFVITCTGANPIELGGGRELNKDESAELQRGDRVVICSYEMIIQ